MLKPSLQRDLEVGPLGGDQEVGPLGGALMNGISALIKETAESSLAPSVT